MQEINIRKGELSDLPYLYEICLKTGENGKDATELFHDEFLIGQYYAAPYLVFPSGICIVAELNFRPQGYVIAAPDSIAFDKWMEEQWLPPLRNRYAQLAPLVQGSEFTPSEYIRSKKEAEILKKIFEKGVPAELQPWFTDYPAHLHIDLLPTLQGKGLGRTLMDKLFEELKQKGIPGIHLGVSAENSGAVAFYQKLGFSVLKEHPWGFTMGKLV